MSGGEEEDDDENQQLECRSKTAQCREHLLYPSPFYLIVRVDHVVGVETVELESVLGEMRGLVRLHVCMQLGVITCAFPA